MSDTIKISNDGKTVHVPRHVMMVILRDHANSLDRWYEQEEADILAKIKDLNSESNCELARDVVTRYIEVLQSIKQSRDYIKLAASIIDPANAIVPVQP